NCKPNSDLASRTNSDYRLKNDNNQSQLQTKIPRLKPKSKSKTKIH
ncbi:hypothetical protein LINPERHAP1_LOCUS38350, partial [Linum perenne]